MQVPVGCFGLIEEGPRRDDPSGVFRIGAGNQHRALEAGGVQATRDALQNRDLLVDGERDGPPEGARGAREAGEGCGKHQAIGFLGQQKTERAGPVGVHAHGNERAVPADRTERDEDQIAALLEIELHLAAGHLVDAAGHRLGSRRGHRLSAQRSCSARSDRSKQIASQHGVRSSSAAGLLRCVA